MNKPHEPTLLQTLQTSSPDETRAIAVRLGRSLPGGATIALIGELGAGKTLFTQGLAEGMGIAGPVVSPTFLLVRTYEGRGLELHHFDFYRLVAEGDLDSFGFDEYFEPGAVCVIEWADRFPGALPRPHLRVEISRRDEDSRKLEFWADGGKLPWFQM